MFDYTYFDILLFLKAFPDLTSQVKTYMCSKSDTHAIQIVFFNDTVDTKDKYLIAKSHYKRE